MVKKTQDRLYVNVVLSSKTKIKFQKKLRERDYNNMAQIFREIVREVVKSE